MLEALAFISGVLLIAAIPPYVIDILKLKTKPERATWLIWSALSTVAFISQASLHGGWSLVFVGLIDLGDIVVLLLSFKYGVGGWTRLDKFAFAVAVIGVVFSLIMRQPVIALIGVIVAGAAGSVPTLIKTFNNPSSETTITWALFGTASLFGALSVGKMELDLLLYPVYMCVSNYSILATKYFGAVNKNRKKLSSSSIGR